MAQWEARSRLHFFLPSNNPSEAFVASKAIDQLSARYGGCTHSLLYPPVFVGYYKRDTQWIRDRIVWLFVDSPEAVTDPALLNFLAQVKNQTKQDYQTAGGSLQDEIWVTVESLFRVRD